MKTYKQIPLEKAYKILNTGALLIISSSNADDQSNLAPIAWNCPVEYDPVTRLLFVCDKTHQTYLNILCSGKFVVCVPHASQFKLVIDLGSCSGKEVKKIEHFSVPIFSSNTFKLPVPEDSIAYAECKLMRVIDEESVGIIVSEVINAEIDVNAFTDRLLSETEAGKTLHHLGSRQFISTGDLL